MVEEACALSTSAGDDQAPAPRARSNTTRGWSGTSLMTQTPTSASAFVGRSAAACGVRALIAAFAPTDTSVLIVAPSGGGKELVARAARNVGAPFHAVR